MGPSWVRIPPPPLRRTAGYGESRRRGAMSEENVNVVQRSYEGYLDTAEVLRALGR
jgi:hypothetical protein